jgi:hypothetical protein
MTRIIKIDTSARDPDIEWQTISVIDSGMLVMNEISTIIMEK